MRIDTIVAELTPFYGADCPAAVVVRATWPDERILRGTLGGYRRKGRGANQSSAPRSSWSDARSRRKDFRDSALYDADYRRRFRGGAA